MTKNLLSLILFITIGVLSRVIPHPWNFTGITAMAIFAGLLAKDNKFLFIAPLASLFISDLVLGFHNTMFFTYSAFAIVGILNLQFAGKNLSEVLNLKWGRQVSSILGSSVMGSLIFFLISNFGVWFSTTMYPKSLIGILECYSAGLPFLQNQLLGDMFYSLVFLALFNLFSVKQAQQIKII